VEEGQLDQEGQPHHDAAGLFDEPEGRRHRAPRREQVVHDQDALAGRDGVLVHGQGVAPVLELVLDRDRLRRQLPELPDRDEPRAELVRQGAAEDEPPGLDPDDDLDTGLDVAGGELVQDALEGLRVPQEGRDVLEEDALRREILDVPDLRPQLGQVHVESPPLGTGGGRRATRLGAARGLIISP
jgi:hypothetical protein